MAPEARVATLDGERAAPVGGLEWPLGGSPRTQHHRGPVSTRPALPPTFPGSSTGTFQAAPSLSAFPDPAVLGASDKLAPQLLI